MVDVRFVDLGPAGVVLPAERVGVVIAQPHVQLGTVEPFRWSDAARPSALETIRRTLEIACAATHGAEKTHFTVLPEYSVPGLEGIELIESALGAAAWPCGTVVIAGVHGLTGSEYSGLIAREGTHCEDCNCASAVGQQWVNCAITWVKDNSSQVRAWVQPKVFPSWPEMNVSYQTMFQGGSVFVFQGPRSDDTTFRFATVVCFDWIATVGGKKVPEWVLSRLHDEAPNGTEVALSWVFVIQRNEKPSHDTFLNEVKPFFDQAQYPKVRREDACIVFANAAGREGLGAADLFGGTSLVFSHQAQFVAADSPLTFSNGGQRFRGSSLLANYTDVYSRERGSCILSFAQLNPRVIPAGAAGRRLPVERPFVYAVSGSVEPRAPGGPVAGSVKWMQDQLDGASGVAGNHGSRPLSAHAGAECVAQVQAFRGVKGDHAALVIDIAVAAAAARRPDSSLRPPDAWDGREEQAFDHVLSTLNILGIGRTLNIVLPTAHATINSGTRELDVLAVWGDTHEECAEHAKRFSGRSARQVLLVSRDRDNSPWDKEFGSFIQPEQPALDGEVDITNPESSQLHLSYQQLLARFLRATSTVELSGGIDADLAA